MKKIFFVLGVVAGCMFLTQGVLLAENGVKPGKKGGNEVSRAARDAKGAGMKGKEVSGEVRDAVRERKEERNAARYENQKQKMEKRSGQKGKGKAGGKR
ncbi:MAG: hypothetical protein ABH883_00705 [Candidatus Omnitrophota bacterium]